MKLNRNFKYFLLRYLLKQEGSTLAVRSSLQVDNRGLTAKRSPKIAEKV